MLDGGTASDVKDQATKEEGIDVFARGGTITRGASKIAAVLFAISNSESLIYGILQSRDAAALHARIDDASDILGTMDEPVRPKEEAKPPATQSQNPSAQPQKAESDGFGSIESDGLPRWTAEGVVPEDDPRAFERNQRLIEIAQELDQPGAKVEALLREALPLAGFYLWDNNGKRIKAPAHGKGVGLAFTEIEVKAIATAHAAGIRVSVDDFVAALDQAMTQSAPGFSFRPYLFDFLARGNYKGSPSGRSLHTFLMALSSENDIPLTAYGIVPGAKMGGIQGLILTRVLLEAVTHPFWPYAKVADEGSLLAALRPQPDGPIFQGWTEDAAAGVIGEAAGAYLDQIEKHSGKDFSGFKEKAKIANIAASIFKFLCTYSYLKGELIIEAPGNPLKRTLTTDGGEERRVKARFFIDGNAIQDFLKQNRLLANTVAFGQLDFDSPSNQSLPGNQNWDIVQDRFSSRDHAIRLVTPRSDISKLRPGDDGWARITVEGSPRRKRLDPKQTVPIMRYVPIVVTPQVKDTGDPKSSPQQDLTDAVLGAAGLRSWVSGQAANASGLSSGPAVIIVGAVTAAMETAYRMNWFGGRRVTLEVRDVIEAPAVLEFTLTYSGYHRQSTQDSSQAISQRGKLAGTGIGLMYFDPEAAKRDLDKILKDLPPDIRRRMEAEMAKENQADESKITGRLFSGGEISILKDDRAETFARGFGDCDTKAEPSQSFLWNNVVQSYTFAEANTNRFFVSMEANEKTGMATFSLQAADEGQFVQAVRSRGKTRVNRGKRQMTFLEGIRPDTTPDSRGSRGIFETPFTLTRNSDGSKVLAGNGTRDLKYFDNKQMKEVKGGEIVFSWKITVRKPD
jgi:hypothetical protein